MDLIVFATKAIGRMTVSVVAALALYLTLIIAHATPRRSATSRFRRSDVAFSSIDMGFEFCFRIAFVHGHGFLFSPALSIDEHNTSGRYNFSLK